MHNYRLVVYYFIRLGSEKKCEDLCNILFRNDLKILSFGSSEQAKNAYTKEDLKSFWVEMETKRGFGIPFLKGKGFYVSIGWGGAMPYSTGISIKTKKPILAKNLISLGKELFLWAEGCHGYIRLDEPYVQRYKPYTPRMYTPGQSIVNCLSDITWANFFGKPYVDMWGIDKLLNAPSYDVQNFAEDNFLLLTTESPEPDENITTNQLKLKEYLGLDYFYKPPRNEIEYRTDGNGNRYLHTYEPYSYIAPNFWDYYDLSKSTISMPTNKG